MGSDVSTPASPASGLVPASGRARMASPMSASAVDLLSALRTAQVQGQLSAAALGQASGWLQSGALPAAALESLADLVARGAWAELEDRFYKGIAFGTGGMRGRTVGRVSAANELAADDGWAAMMTGLKFRSERLDDSQTALLCAGLALERTLSWIDSGAIGDNEATIIDHRTGRVSHEVWQIDPDCQCQKTVSRIDEAVA